jgi:hypothetical protein
MHCVVDVRLNPAPTALAWAGQQQQRAGARPRSSFSAALGVRLPGHEASGVQKRQLQASAASLACNTQTAYVCSRLEACMLYMTLSQTRVRQSAAAAALP